MTDNTRGKIVALRVEIESSPGSNAVMDVWDALNAAGVDAVDIRMVEPDELPATLYDCTECAYVGPMREVGQTLDMPVVRDCPICDCTANHPIVGGD